MFNLGIGEILVIGIVLIIFVGPDKLPTLMKTVGKGLRTLRQASRDIRTTVGLDELMREDVLRTPPPRLSHPTARQTPAPDAKPAEAAGEAAGESEAGPVAREDALEPPPAAAVDAPPAVGAPPSPAAAAPPLPAPRAPVAGAPPPPAAAAPPLPAPRAPVADAPTPAAPRSPTPGAPEPPADARTDEHEDGR